MSSRNLFVSILVACLPAVGFLGIAPVANAVSAGKSFLKSGESAKKNAKKSARKRLAGIKRRGRGPQRIHLPIGPAYIYYDYPYYYSRGHYPTHIGGYVYYPTFYSRMRYGRYGPPR